MKKWTSMLLAVLLALLPVVSYAQSPMEMLGTLSADRGISVSFQIDEIEMPAMLSMLSSMVSPFLGFDLMPVVSAAVDLAKTVGIEAGIDGDTMVSSVKMKNQEVLDYVVKLAEDAVYVKSSWISDLPLCFTWNEIQQSGGTEAVDALHMVKTMLDCVSNMNFVITQSVLASYQAQAIEETVYSQPYSGVNAVKTKTLTIDKSRLETLVMAIITDIQLNPPAMKLLTSGGATANEVLDGLRRELLTLVPQIGTLAVVTWHDGDGTEVGWRFSTEDGYGYGSGLQHYIVGTEGNKKTFHGSVFSKSSYSGERESLVWNGTDSDSRTDFTATEGSGYNSATISGSIEKSRSGGSASDKITVNISAEGTTITLTSDISASRSGNGVDWKAKNSISIPLSGDSFGMGNMSLGDVKIGYTVGIKTGYTAPNISMDNAIHYLSMSSSERNDFDKQMETRAQNKLMSIVQLLPSSLVDLLTKFVGSAISF